MQLHLSLLVASSFASLQSEGVSVSSFEALSHSFVRVCVCVCVRACMACWRRSYSLSIRFCHETVNAWAEKRPGGPCRGGCQEGTRLVPRTLVPTASSIAGSSSKAARKAASNLEDEGRCPILQTAILDYSSVDICKSVPRGRCSEHQLWGPVTGCASDSSQHGTMRSGRDVVWKMNLVAANVDVIIIHDVWWQC